MSIRVSVFLYGDSLVGECSRWLWAQVQILFTISLYKNTLVPRRDN